MKTPILAQLSDALDLAALLTLLFPLAFPILALLDGAQSAHIESALFHCVGAMLLSSFGIMLLTGLSAWLDELSRNREADAKAFHAYLSAGGRA